MRTEYVTAQKVFPGNTKLHISRSCSGRRLKFFKLGWSELNWFYFFVLKTMEWRTPSQMNYKFAFAVFILFANHSSKQPLAL